MSAPDPCANPELLGHASAEAEFLHAARRGRLHHAWLIAGPSGIGKATLAYRLARRLLAGLPPEGEGARLDPRDPTFRRVAAGGHADVKTVTLTADPRTGRLHREILVDDARAGAAFLHRTAIEGGWRVLIVDPAEALNANAANALLKVVEEPPERALLLLVCAAPGRLPVTLRSRCRMLRLAPLEQNDVEALLEGFLGDVSAEERARLARLAEGSPGRALRLAAKEGAAIAGLVQETLRRLPEFGPADAYAVADRLGREESAFGVFMELLLSRIATAVRAATRGSADQGQKRMLGNRPLDAWSEVWQALSNLTAETERLNLDKRQALISGLMLLNGT